MLTKWSGYFVSKETGTYIYDGIAPENSDQKIRYKWGEGTKKTENQQEEK